MIAAGEFTELITFQQKNVIRNGIGDEVVTWSDVATVWAKIMPLRGNAFFTANQQQHVIDARFLIREGPGITNAMRILWNDGPYDITSLIPGTGPYKATIEIHAVHGVRDGR